jgi:hypothetical protein
MKKITNLIIIDASSSMWSKENEVKEGLTGLLKNIKKDMKKNKGEAKTKTIICQFNSPGTFQVLLNSSKISKINDNIANNYSTGGSTSLFDAIGTGFSLVGKKQDGVFVSILTDGEENSSREFSQKDIKKLFKKAKKAKWGLTFMGTTEESIQNAVSWGINISNTFQFDDSGKGIANSNVTRDASRSLYYASVLSASKSKDIQTTNLVETEVETDENNEA